MKKLKLAFGIFSVLIFLGTSQAPFSATIVLDRGRSADDLDYLEKVANKRPDTYRFNSRDSFRVTLDGGREYFLASTITVSRVKVEPGFQGYPGGRGYCEFNFFNKKYEYVNGIKVKIQDAADTNVCNWIYGVSAVVYKKQPALLVTVQYHLGIDPARTVEEIGRGYHDFTTLLVLDPRPDGSLAIRQDDECLGAMNHIDTLAIAKKRLVECSR